MQETTKLNLPDTNVYRTLREIGIALDHMDATAQTLIRKLRDAEMQTRQWMQKVAIYRQALRDAGISLKALDNDERMDDYYVTHQPFARLSLTETCKRVLQDSPNRPLAKKDVEYMAARGGYVSQAKDKLNSFEITLRRLADSGFCDIEKGAGSRPNRYIYRVRQKGDDASATK